MIPNKFHFIFGLKEQEQPFHLVYYLCLLSCIKVNAPSELHLYYDHEPYGPYWESIRNKITLHKVTAMKRLNGYELNYAHQADFLRIDILNQCGGVYADIDTIFVSPIDNKLYGEDFVMGREDIPYPFYGLCNALIMARKGSEFGKKRYNGALIEYNGSWNYHSVRYPKELAINYPQLIHVEPQRSFYKHMWDEKGIKCLFSDIDYDISGCYSFHLWENVSWVDHLKNLKESDIVNPYSTYGMIARNILS